MRVGTKMIIIVASSIAHIPEVGQVRDGDSWLLAQEVKLQLPAEDINI